MTTKLTAQEVLNTIGYNGFVRSLFNRSANKDLSKDFAHAVMGICTEYHEFINSVDPVNAVEEAGDLAFYLEAMSQVLDGHDCGMTLPEIQQAETKEAARMAGFGPGEVRNELNELLDVAKRWVGYGREPKLTPAQLTGWAMALVGQISTFGPPQVKDYDKVIHTNVEKLLERYNGIHFSADRAINRDTAAERVILENAAA